ncbi:MAG: peptidylprolyl isomerase [Gemmatimonadaceae bacterium]|nr:peptidylprolyl isomerase [Gemmatimonadaceae bacterium]
MRRSVARALWLGVVVATAATAQKATPTDTTRPAPKPAVAAGLPVDRVVAVVGTHPVLMSEVLDNINQQRARGLQLPPDSLGQIEVARRVLGEIVDEEVLVNVAKHYKIEIADGDVNAQVDKRLKDIRSGFRDDREFREAMKNEGFGSAEEYRKVLVEQAKRGMMQQRAIDSLRAKGRMPPVAVSEKEISEAYEKNKATFPARPATVTFHQIIVPFRPSKAANDAAFAKLDSLRNEINAGADFGTVAKRESMDPGSGELGGDLGWNRRGNMVPAFDDMMFRLIPGVVSPIIRTGFGFHIIKVDRARPGEVKARHILIRPLLDSASVARAKLEADTVLREWKAGVPYDTLAARHHDDASAELRLANNIPRDTTLPQAYRDALDAIKVGEWSAPFEIPDPISKLVKIVVLKLEAEQPGGAYTVADLRERIKGQLAEEKTIRRVLDQLRKEQYVSLRL